MKIGILTDSLIANLPLMKIQAYFKNCEWYFPLKHYQYDKIFYSKIFNFTEKIDNEDDFIIGGTGYNLKTNLPSEIDSCQPDYSIYPDCDYSLQYFSRGCIRKCSFCVVPEKEGIIHTVKPMKLNPKGIYIRVLDNNFFANQEWRESIKELKKYNQPVLFDSGLDIRLFNYEQGEALQEIKIYKMVHIAWDNPKQDLTVKIKEMTKYIKGYKIMVYVLIGYDSSPEEDYFRVMKIKELGCKPFVMPFNKKNEYQRKFARWVNHKAIFNKIDFKDYNKIKIENHQNQLTFNL
jgi:hypothetical protein